MQDTRKIMGLVDPSDIWQLGLYEDAKGLTFLGSERNLADWCSSSPLVSYSVLEGRTRLGI